MRKHSVRKWIHAICDMLPLLVIPIFALAVRSDNNFEPISITVGESGSSVDYDYQQYILNGEPNSLSNIENWAEGTLTYSDNKLHWVGSSTQYGRECDIRFEYNGDFNVGDVLLFSFDYSITSTVEDSRVIFQYYYDEDLDENIQDSLYFDFDNLTGRIQQTFNASALMGGNPYFDIDFITYSSNQFDLFNVQIFNLTYTFGSGNEPTIQDFNNIFTDSYYDYTLNGIFTVSTSGTQVVYDDTDVGSQMVYTLYNTCDKYFNFNQVGVFNSLYNSIVNNFFNGVAPLGLYIVWNIVLFEFIMDVLFLVYMVFMFIIDFTESMIDRAFYKVDRGCK